MTKREACSIGGKAISQNLPHMREIGRRGGLKTSQDREHMAELGRLGAIKKRELKAIRQALALKTKDYSSV